MDAEVRDSSTTLFPSDDELKQICRLGEGGNCCPFLVAGKRFECWRMNYPASGTIWTRIDAGTMNAKGKYCSGEEWERLLMTAVGTAPEVEE